MHTIDQMSIEDRLTILQLEANELAIERVNHDAYGEYIDIRTQVVALMTELTTIQADTVGVAPEDLDQATVAKKAELEKRLGELLPEYDRLTRLVEELEDIASDVHDRIHAVMAKALFASTAALIFAVFGMGDDEMASDSAPKEAEMSAEPEPANTSA